MNDNLNDIKNVVKTLLYTKIHETEDSPFIVIHPIFSCAVVKHPVTNAFCNMLEDKEVYSAIIDKELDRINNAKSINQLYFLITKTYRLTFIKMVEQYLSIEEFSKLFSSAWVSCEHPNDDPNVSKTKLIKMFNKADKHFLMDEDDLHTYNNLPEQITVYRGFSNRHNRTNIKHGLSWTTNLETAEWFANRLSDNGFIFKATALKKDVLAYFNNRNEYEIVIDPNKLINIETV